MEGALERLRDDFAIADRVRFERGAGGLVRAPVTGAADNAFRLAPGARHVLPARLRSGPPGLARDDVG